MSEVIIELTDEQLDFLSGNSACKFENGEPKWYYIPYVFTRVEGNRFKIQGMSQLPQHVKDFFRESEVHSVGLCPLEMVYEFHTYSGHPIEPFPKLPDIGEHTFRVGFMKEESEEADEAYTNMDIINYADSLGDLQYVLDGWWLTSGLWHKKQEIMEEIHRSNMTKFCKTVEEAEATIDKLVSKHFEPLPERKEGYITVPAYYYEQVRDLFVVKNRQGKVQKGINYDPPKLGEILYGYSTHKRPD